MKLCFNESWEKCTHTFTSYGLLAFTCCWSRFIFHGHESREGTYWKDFLLEITYNVTEEIFWW